MLEPPNHQTTAKTDQAASMSIQLLLFVDERPSSHEYIQPIRDYIKTVSQDCPCQLEVIEIHEQPHLVEHFRLVATPALVKVVPEPRQTLAGSNLVNQLKKWWPKWLSSLEENHHDSLLEKSSNVGYSGELMRLSDEIFRLKKDKENLQEQLKFKDQVLAMLAHDLRSPLTAASIAVETLELAKNQDPTEKQQKLTAQLFNQTRNQFRVMNRLITDILQASKSMNAQLQVHQTEVFLPRLSKEIVEQYNDLLTEKSLKLIQDVPQDVPGVYADEELIRQVIVNLIDNAIKYTSEGGEITLSILHRTSQKVQVSVCDTGPGIPEEKQERIFEGHFRLQRDQGKEGYGLGLSLCRKIIRVHYGQIWVDSVPGQGSCFHFTLPVYR
ncbi:adaptive-response sensory histidine kinase [Crocosphaera subtropica ATCC 51142]|uniref:Adaptive-response sensory kinase SasA n=1 Tax=Crocosphaera subtropica (strain ATCC 51142 / BH68) TaxID=43989 RepID=SASA_CROS5|nr:histidine kinase [Crocosphaera subtropica]B1WYT4.1 RecName: Full=Adaptive-response sensory kinase SasA; AltName: Full=Sensor histidine kinase SasA [Crocosphaera subtropica ATCC 51142]ACB51101.1 adaptive-response sensory histidine kinase [Crocosphaera subtropica ATCC 51142]